MEMNLFDFGTNIKISSENLTEKPKVVVLELSLMIAMIFLTGMLLKKPLITGAKNWI